MSRFEFVTLEEFQHHSNQSASLGDERKHNLVQTLEELKSSIYPPNPSYDISEKPWLPGPKTP